jgi:hypothetical protein
MEKAKQAVSGFLSKDGKHDTTVHESVNPAVTQERVNRTQHENATKAVDREVHQDHHHTSIQPVQDREVLPEQHTHNMAGVEHREIKHGDDSHIKDRLASEQQQFKNTREVGDVHRTSSVGETVAGEHVHHHVHENIQPVVQKETIQNSVVHTTIPVHEVHQNEPKHHTASALPAVSMSDFKHQGGSLSGREERTDAFRGEPNAIGGALGGDGARGTTSLTETDGSSRHHNAGMGNSHGTHNDSSLTGSHNSHGTHDSKYDSSRSANDGKKPSLLDKLNPKKDTDGDAKAGMMD